MFGIRKMKEGLRDLCLVVDALGIRIQAAEFYSKGRKEEVAKLEAQNKKLEDRLWLLENPPKYKVGQVVKGMIVTSVEVVGSKIKIHQGNPPMNFYDLLNKNAQNGESNIFNRKAWQYKAIKKGMIEPIEIL